MRSRHTLAITCFALVTVLIAACRQDSMIRSSDPQAACSPDQPVPPGTLRATFLGVTTILFDDGETALMTDGFFSRPAFKEVAMGVIAPDRARIEDALGKAGVTRLAAVLTAHSHHDHAMDTPVVAAMTGAVIVGSESTANIARGLDFPKDRVRVIRGGEQLVFGRFTIRVIKSPHSPGALFPGEITSPLRPPAPAREYKEGGNYSFLIEHDKQRILVHPSANFSPGALDGVHADVVFLGMGTLGKQSDQFARDYWREVVRSTGARLVIPIHWDNFFRPLAEPLEPLPRPFDDVERGMKALTRMSEADHVTVTLPTLFRAMDLSISK